MKILSKDDLFVAQKRIKDSILKTRFEYSRSASEWVGTQVFLKFENEQITGSFKIRGALNKILCLVQQGNKKKGGGEKIRGIVAASSGNHAQGVAYGARRVGVPAFIFMPENSPLVKVEATRSYGAKVILEGKIFDKSYKLARNFGLKNGYTFIHPFEDFKVLAGQGTIGLEVLDEISDLDSIIVPVGGGGLISGIGFAMKTFNPRCKVYGAMAENFSGMKEMFYKMRKKQVPFKKTQPIDKHHSSDLGVDSNGDGFTIADGIAVKEPSLWIYKNCISKYVDEIVQVSEEDIAESVVFLMERAKTVVEAAGAIALAAAVKSNLKLGEKTAIILSGGNIDLNLISKVIEKGLSKQGRIAWFSVIVKDQPGVLKCIVDVISTEGVNILDVRHERLSVRLKLNEIRIDFLLETRNMLQVENIKKNLEKNGTLIL